MSKLTSFNFQFSVAHIFREDIDALKAFFINGKPLVGPGLEHFATFLRFMTKLESVHIKLQDFRRHVVKHHEEKREDGEFLNFTFTGIREKMLWVELDKRIQGNAHLDHQNKEQRKLGNAVMGTKFPAGSVRDGRDYILNYEAWKVKKVIEVDEDATYWRC
jgi:hypothetical protein